MNLKADAQVDQQLLDVQLSALRHVLSPYPGAYTGLMVGALLLIYAVGKPKEARASNR